MGTALGAVLALTACGMQRPGSDSGEPPRAITVESPVRESQIPEFRRRLASIGVEVRVKTTAVPPAEHGTVQSVRWPNEAEMLREAPYGRLRVPEGMDDPVIVHVGRGDPALRVPREFAEAIRTRDPRELEARLRRLGHEIRWTVIVFHPERAARDEPPTTDEDVDRPPPGTCVIGVWDEDGGRIFGRPPETVRAEIASPASAAALNHAC